MERKEIGAVRIVPGACEPGTPHRTQGTQVLMPDGTPIPRVYRVELEADADNVWRAVIHCHAHAPEVVARGTVVTAAKPLSEDQVATLKTAWEESINTPSLFARIREWFVNGLR